MRAPLEMRRGGRRLRPAAALPAVALVLGACGGDGGGNPDGAASEESPTSSTSAAGSASDPTPETEALVQMADALRFDQPEVVLKVGGNVTLDQPLHGGPHRTGDPAEVADATHVELPPGATPWDSGQL